MLTKIVYALVSNENDYYLEQALISVYSLKQVQQDAFVELVIDTSTNKNLKGKRSKILSLIDKKNVVSPPPGFTKAQISRYLKTNLRQIVEGPFLFVDTDTIIVERLDSIDDLISKGVDISAVKDNHCDFSFMRKRNLMIERSSKIGWTDIVNDKIHFNSGVMFVNETKYAHDFYKKWYSNWIYEKEKGLFFDQLALAKTARDDNYPIVILDDGWNCQICEDGLKFLYQAKIIHYYGDRGRGRAYYFRNSEVFEDIKQKGDISKEIAKQISLAKSAFQGHVLVLGNEDVDFVSSNLKTLYSHHRSTFCLIDRIVGGYLNARKQIKQIIKWKK